MVYQGTPLGYCDNITLPYEKELEGTNALLISAGNHICGIFSLCTKGNRKDKLFLLKGKTVECQEASIKNYHLLMFTQDRSELLYHLYHQNTTLYPAQIMAYKVPLIDFSVKVPPTLRMPLAIDFGSTNTTAGVYLDSVYFEQAGKASHLKGMEKNTIQYTSWGIKSYCFCRCAKRQSNGMDTGRQMEVVGFKKWTIGSAERFSGFDR